MSEKPSTFPEPRYAKSDKAKTDYPWYSPNIDKYLIPEVSRNDVHAMIIAWLTPVMFVCRRRNC